MFNPFYPFQQRLFQPMVAKGARYFLLQSYPRGEGFMLRHYKDIGLAQEHYDSIKHDSVRKLYDWNSASDQLELKQLVNNNRVFAFLKIPDAEQIAEKMLDEKLRDYIANHTQWKPRRDDEVSFDLDFIFGDVYVVLKYRGERKKIKLDQLEKV